MIKFSLCVTHVLYNVFTIKINLLKYKRFKSGRCTYKNTGSSTLKVLTISPCFYEKGNAALHFYCLAWLDRTASIVLVATEFTNDTKRIGKKSTRRLALL